MSSNTDHTSAAPLAPSRPTRMQWVETALIYALLLAGTALVLVPVLRSTFTWRFEHDAPLLMYMSFAFDRFNMVPYRDFFDVNMLGSYLSYEAIGRLFGYNDPGVRNANLVVTLLLMAGIAGMTWRLGLRAMWAGALIFALVYLREGPTMMLQRELLALIPISLGVACAGGLPGMTPLWRAILAGAAFGCAASVKPHLLIGLPFVVLYLAEERCAETPGWRPRITALFWNAFQVGLGLAIPVLGVIGYLLYYGALDDFLSSALHYVPLYAELTGDHQLLAPEVRSELVQSQFFLMGYRWPFLVMGIAGLFAALGNRRLNPSQRRLSALLTMLALAYMGYPAVTGQFWNYHYLPMVLFMCTGAGLAFSPLEPGAPWQQRWAPMLLVLLVVCATFAPHKDFEPLYRFQHNVPKGGRVDQMANYLKEHLRPGDTVQPLDWVVGGVAHAMLLAEAKPATSFICYFHFFHHVDTPYIQQLRKRFVRELTAAHPRFIVEWTRGKSGWIVPGPRTATNFPEVEAYIQEHYHRAHAGAGFIIHERNSEEPTSS